MRHPTPDYVLVALREALQSLSWAIPAMIMVSMLGGAIPTIALWDDLNEDEAWVLLAVSWIGHWALAGMMLWGLVPLLVLVWCLAELLHGTRNPIVVLVVALLVQLAVSTLAVYIFADDDQRIRLASASGSAAVIAVVTAAVVSRRSTKHLNAQQVVRENAG